MFKTERTLWVGGLDPKVDEDLLIELFSHTGVVINIKIPNRKYSLFFDSEDKFDESSFSKSNYAFVEFQSNEDCIYSQKIMNNITLYNRPITCTASIYSGKETNNNTTIVVRNFKGSTDDEQNELRKLAEQFGKINYLNIENGIYYICYSTIDEAFKAEQSLNNQLYKGNQLTVKLRH